MMKSKIAKVVAVFAVLLAVGIALLMLGPQNDAASIASARKAGVLTAEEVAVAFEKVSAKLIELPVIESQHVKKGDILMQLDPTDTRLAIASVKAQLDQNTASIEKAKSELAVTKKQYHRAATLRKTGAGSESNVDETLNAYQAAKAGLKELQANRVALEVELETLAVEEQRLTLRAPEDGKVLELLYEPGEMVPASSAAVILETDRRYYDIYVSEAQVNRYQEGSEVTGYAVAIDKNVTGEVRIATAAPSFADLRMTREHGTADLTSFKVRIYVKPTEGLLTGMTIEVDHDR